MKTLPHTRTLTRKISELEAACRRRRRSLGERSLFEIDSTDLNIEQVLSASIKSVKTIATGNPGNISIAVRQLTRHFCTAGTSLTKSLTQINQKSSSGGSGGSERRSSRLMWTQQPNITGSLFNSGSSGSSSSQVSVMMPRRRRQPGETIIT